MSDLYEGYERARFRPDPRRAAVWGEIAAYLQRYVPPGSVVLDLDTGERRTVPAPELRLGYRTSAIKQGWRAVVLSVVLALESDPDGLSRPIAYAQLADALGVAIGERAPLAGVRAPALVLMSRNSTLTDPARTRAVLEALPEVQFKVLEAEHWIPTEQPEAMRSAIEDWLAGRSRR